MTTEMTTWSQGKPKGSVWDDWYIYLLIDPMKINSSWPMDPSWGFMCSAMDLGRRHVGSVMDYRLQVWFQDSTENVERVFLSGAIVYPFVGVLGTFLSILFDDN